MNANPPNGVTGPSHRGAPRLKPYKLPEKQKIPTMNAIPATAAGSATVTTRSSFSSHSASTTQRETVQELIRHTGLEDAERGCVEPRLQPMRGERTEHDRDTGTDRAQRKIKTSELHAPPEAAVWATLTEPGIADDQAATTRSCIAFFSFFIAFCSS